MSVATIARPARLLTQQVAPVTRRQAQLTRQFLAPLGGELERYMLELRAEADQALSHISAYPLGLCTEISTEVYHLLVRRLRRPSDEVERMLLAFIRRGGIVRHVWGALRERYFQNAFQFGALYVDVSNDTVVTSKPKVEILPLADSGLRAVLDLDHFARIAQAYWDMPLYANHALPELAPLFPMVGCGAGQFGLCPACDYMIDLIISSGFAASRAWLASAPPVPPELARECLRGTAAAAHMVSGDGGRAALAACDAAAMLDARALPAWRAARVSDFKTLLAPAHVAAEPSTKYTRTGGI